MNLFRVIKFIATHPLNKERRLGSVKKFLRYQLATRLFDSKIIINWVNGSKIISSRGETGLTGNIYCGLMEYEDMSFLLHYLREEDEFYDIGANAGAYTVLASAVIGAESIAFEPLPSTYDRLIDQIRINRIESLVKPYNCGVGDKAGSLEFTKNLDCMNRVNTDPSNKDVTEVEVVTLDESCKVTRNAFVKIDVEGFEKFVLDGGKCFFSSDQVSALIVELNGSGASFGVADSEIHEIVTSFGFSAVAYDPFSRKVIPIESFNLSGNTIYVKDIALAQTRVKCASPVCIHTADDAKL